MDFITITEVEAIARVSFGTNTTVASFGIRAFRVFGASTFLLAFVDVYSETMKSLSVDIVFDKDRKNFLNSNSGQRFLSYIA